MITIKRWSEYTFDQALKLWNDGFQGYAMDMTFSLDQLMNRFGLEGISADASLVAEVDGELAGFVLNGIADVGGTTVAWNGGTGVAPAYRGHGVGARLVEASLALYRDRGVGVAILEALASNTPAIGLYEKLGYAVTGRLAITQSTDSLREEVFVSPIRYQTTPIHPAQASKLRFYNVHASWQNAWNRIQGAEAVAVLDESGTVAGYALYTRSFDADGNVRSIVLYQCEVGPDFADADNLVHTLLHSVFYNQGKPCSRVGFNLPTENERVCTSLESAGFTPVVEQVHMSKTL